MITGTQSIDVSEVSKSFTNNELFCFGIHPYSSATYLTDFVEKLNPYLPNYVFSNDVQQMHEKRIKKGLSKTSLLDRARKLLQKTQAGRVSDSGEFAEFLLFLFAKQVKGAHKLTTKIQSRGSDLHTIIGRDGSYIWKDLKGEIYMLLGEAKGTPDANDGLREGQSDINKFWASDKINHEIELASTHIRSELNNETADLYESYFIDDNPNHAQLKYKNIVFVCYSVENFNDLIKGTSSPKKFQDTVITDLKRCFKNQKKLIDACPQSSVYCFFPVACINEARNTFAKHHNLTV